MQAPKESSEKKRGKKLKSCTPSGHLSLQMLKDMTVLFTSQEKLKVFTGHSIF